METLILLLVFFLTEASESGLSVTDYFSMAKDFFTIIALIGGLYLGHKGIKKYLIEDIIKDRVKSVHAANSQAREITNKIIQEINDKDDISRPADEDDVLHINSLTKKLVSATSDSSSEIHSLAFLLYETTKNIQLSIRKEVGDTKRYEGRTASEFYNLVLHTSSKINFFASNIIDIPKSTRTIKYHEIKKKVRKYLSKTGFKTLKDFQTGLDLDSNSSTSLIFFNLLNRSTNDYIFARKFFLAIRDNTPILYHLYVNEIYFPLVLNRQDDSPMLKMFYEGKLHLIKIEKKETTLGENDGRIFYELTYSNLIPFVRFVDNITKKKLIDSYRDSFIDKHQNHFAGLIKKFTLLGEESLKVECDEEDAKAYYKMIKRDFKKKLKAL
ncbi:MAG: hypothetical protein WD052_11910 [Bacteroidales bacterium]